MNTSLPDLALVGKAGVGKTTTAILLEDLFFFRRIAIADGIRRVAKATLDLPAGKAAQRPLLQQVGAALRSIDPDCWLRLAVRQTEEIHSRGALAVLDDVRLPYEVNYLQRHGFIVIGLTLPDEKRFQRLLHRDGPGALDALGDITETSVDKALELADRQMDTTASSHDVALAVLSAYRRAVEMKQQQATIAENVGDD